MGLVSRGAKSLCAATFATTNRVGPDVLVRAGERSSPGFVQGGKLPGVARLGG